MVLVGVAGVVVGVAMAAALLLAAGGGEVDVRLGDDEFRAGRTAALAPAIGRDGPIAFGDLVGGDRPIFVQHRSDDLDEGWVAHDAVAPGQPPTCVLEWDSAADRFRDPCGDDTYDPDDPALRTYPTEVRDGFVYVDLRGG